MADIVKPLLGKPGWNVAVDAAIDKVNAHETALAALAPVATSGAYGDLAGRPMNPIAAAIIFGG